MHGARFVLHRFVKLLSRSPKPAPHSPFGDPQDLANLWRPEAFPIEKLQQNLQLDRNSLQGLYQSALGLPLGGHRTRRRAQVGYSDDSEVQVSVPSLISPAAIQATASYPEQERREGSVAAKPIPHLETGHKRLLHEVLDTLGYLGSEESAEPFEVAPEEHTAGIGISGLPSVEQCEV